MNNTLLEKKEREKCRKTFCEETAMRYGSFDRGMVGALDTMHRTTTDWSLCSKCNYWLQQSGKPGLIKIRDDGRWWHYNIQPEDHPESMKGLYGRRHTITVTDCEANHPDLIGKTLETTNLWSQGEIPIEYHKVMETAPDKIFVEITSY